MTSPLPYAVPDGLTALAFHVPLSLEELRALYDLAPAHPDRQLGGWFAALVAQREEAQARELRPGQPLDGRYVRSLVARLATKAGIGRRVHPHMLRHTCLTQLYDRTRNLRLVQDVAGHGSSRHTERYTHVHPVAVAEAMGALE